MFYCPRCLHKIKTVYEEYENSHYYECDKCLFSSDRIEDLIQDLAKAVSFNNRTEQRRDIIDELDEIKLNEKELISLNRKLMSRVIDLERTVSLLQSQFQIFFKAKQDAIGIDID
jgi:uncharacterized Zn finger protein (UPF0148 family)